jgi:serine/threonine protein kinase/Flp pilus assembly protein TadD
MGQATLSSPSLEERVDRAGSDAGFDPDSSHLDAVTAVAAVRLQSPQSLGLNSWGKSVHGNSDQARLFADLHRSDPEAAHRLAQAVLTLPEVGTELLGFRLLAELGKGAFGRVYLAQQGDLADRSVVLKICPDVHNGESRTLARLQHTNIVPVYSIHRAGPLQAVCMPYFGATTLAHVQKDLQVRDSLPLTGRELVSTIIARKSAPPSAQTAPPSSVALTKVKSATPTGVMPPSLFEPAADSSFSAALPSDAVESTANFEVLERLSYVEAVLWIGARIADGLAHAHERGIVHRDLKPANILLTDDGQPMLLDFNLAQDTKLRGSAAGAQVGGTLPFMAPEQIEAFRTETLLVDCRSDIYSFGVILYELLTGRHPFPVHRGPVQEVLVQMIQDRQGPPPALRCWNKAVSPAVESLVRRCLEPDLNGRYQSARQLKEDLDRHLDNLPLRYAPEPSLIERSRKWVRRHPRLASTTTVGAVTAVLIFALFSLVLIRGERLAAVDARNSMNRFLDETKAVRYLLTTRTNETGQLDAGIALGRRLLGSYDVLQNPAWDDSPAVQYLTAADQAVLRENTGGLLLLVAQGLSLQAANQSDRAAREELLGEAVRLNGMAASCFGSDEDSRAVLTQRAHLTELLGNKHEAQDLRDRAGATPLRTASDRYLVAAEHISQARYGLALPLLSDATEKNPQDFWSWFLQGACNDGLSRSADAAACYGTCIALSPRFPWAYHHRGVALLRQLKYRQAASDFDQAIALEPTLIESYRQRALARQGLKDYDGAIADVTRALELGGSATQLYFLRAEIRDRSGDRDGAKSDRAAGMQRKPSDDMDWVSRGYARMAAEPEAALRDFDEALKLNPRSLVALQNKAHVLGRLNRNDEAARVLDQAVELYPDFIRARAGRGVVLARIGEREAAHRDADECLARDNQPSTLYQLAGIYALTSQKNPDDRRQALHLLSVALQKGFGFDVLEIDRDLDPVRSSPEFRKLVDAAQAIRSSAVDKQPKTVKR